MRLRIGSTSISRTCATTIRVSCLRRSRTSRSSPVVSGPARVTRFKMTAGGRTRDYRMKIAEPEPGRVLTESDMDSSAVTTFTVSPQGGASLVRISTAWDGAGGIGGLFERLFAPRVLRAIYADELKRLDAYARERHSP